jgi:hypothetical protein
MDAFSRSCLDKLKEADGLRKLLDYVAALPIADWKTKNPDQDGVLTLLKAMMTSLLEEKKKDASKGSKDLEMIFKRADALGNLINWVETQPVSVFKEVNAYRAGIQLAARLRRPRILDQGKCGFCGPASILVEVAKRTPDFYIEYATSLIQYGAGNLRVDHCRAFPLQLPPTAACDWHSGARALPEVDYVTLRAMRTIAEFLLKGDPDQPAFHIDQPDSHATSPEQIALLLQNAGYTDVRDCTVNWYGAGRAGLFDKVTMRSNLEALIREKAVDPNHRVVMMLINVALADLPRLLQPYPALQKLGYSDQKLFVEAQKTHRPWQERWAPTRLTELHWITLRSIELSGDQVVMKSVTWKGNPTLTLEVDLFCGFYYGYVIGTV